MPGSKRADASHVYGKEQGVLEKMMSSGTEEQEAHDEQLEEGGKPKAKGRTLKQVAFAIGSERERKLDDLAYQYNRQRATRIGRNDIARYLFDTLTLEDLLEVDLLEHKK